MAHGDRSVDVFIRKLRQKLQNQSPNWRYIHTHFGIGYRFDPQRVDGTEEPLETVAPIEIPAERVEEVIEQRADEVTAERS
jgi:DNA-binding winged helix-turn-helix (wHTH) protein